MSSLGEILRGARMQQGRTLDDIAAATRINKKYLQQIEAGESLKMPETYVRAFIRAFAAEVGVDPETLYPGEAPKSPAATSPAMLREAVSAGGSELSGAPAGVGKGSGLKGNPSVILFFVALIGIAGMVAIILWMRNDRERKPVQEISFADVVRDRESQGGSDGTVSADSLSFGHPVVGRDSLTLEATTTDSVWLRIVSDSATGRETVLPPQSQARWRARYRFALSVGNAKSISFRLNGKQLAPLSVNPKPMSNIIYSWSTLDTMQRSSGKAASPPASVSKPPGTQGPPAVTKKSAMGHNGAKRPQGTSGKKKSGKPNH